MFAGRLLEEQENGRIRRWIPKGKDGQSVGGEGVGGAHVPGAGRAAGRRVRGGFAAEPVSVEVG